MKRGWLLLATGATALFMLMLMSFGQRRYARIPWQQTQLYWENAPQQTFLTGRQVRKAVGQMYPSLEGKLLEEINMALLEEKLENHPSIKRVEVFSKLEGKLCIRIWQHQPLARVHSQDQRYYLLEGGEHMPLSLHYAAQVPLVTGALPDSLHRPMAQLISHLRNDPFYQDFFTGLHLENPQDIRLYPSDYSHHIYLGSLQAYPEKLEKLRLFYQTVYPPSTPKDIESIDLRYDDQVVCQ
jgi:cell division protein FtsQ